MPPARGHGSEEVGAAGPEVAVCCLPAMAVEPFEVLFLNLAQSCGEQSRLLDLLVRQALGSYRLDLRGGETRFAQRRLGRAPHHHVDTRARRSEEMVEDHPRSKAPYLVHGYREQPARLPVDAVPALRSEGARGVAHDEEVAAVAEPPLPPRLEEGLDAE